jgi:glycosyltransferase involved in cell wall biosynthesis
VSFREASGSPLVSVVIPTFDRWPLVKEAVESALQQDANHTEVIVVDDGSTDGTSEALTTGFPEVRLLRQANAERGVARNRGAGEARGKYLCFLDSDDVLEPWHVSQLQHLLNRRTADFPPVASAPAVLWDPKSGKSRPLKTADFARRRPLPEACLIGTVLPVQGLFVTAFAFSAVGGFPEDRAVAGSEDWVFLARLAARFPVDRLPDHSVRIRDHPGRSVLDPVQTEASSLAAMDLMLKEGVCNGPLHGRSRQLVVAGAHMLSAANFYGAGQMVEARRHLADAARGLPAGESVRMLGRRWAQTWLGPAGSRALRAGRNAFAARLEQR